MLKGWVLIIAVLLAFFAAPACAADGKLFATVDYSYADYQARVEGEEAISASHLTQKYTLGYRKANRLYNGQGGAYSLALGYEHTVLDPELSVNGVADPTVKSITTDKLLYKADLMLAPGGLPFRLYLFAQDLNSSSFTQDSTASMLLPVGGQDITGHLIDPQVFTDINNGTHQTFGATLLVGIRNGSYLGLYRDVLSQLPRMLIDYKQTEVKDLHGQADGGTHYRDRDLAFVSLNKKDNWLHYRLRDYKDYVRPLQNEKSSQVILGSIDQALQRQWINLTNWIKISADGTYTVTEEARSATLNSDRRYDLNLLTQARRDNMTLSNYNQFRRQDNGVMIEQELLVPLNYNLEIDRDTRLSMYFIGERAQNETRRASLTDIETSDNGSFYLHTQGQLHRTADYFWTPTLDVEKKYGTNGTGQGVRFGLEVASNRTLQAGRNLVVGNILTYVDGTTSDEVYGNSVQDELYARWDQRLSSTLRCGVQGKVIYLNGLSDNSMTNRIHTMVDVPMTYSSGTMLLSGHQGWALRTTETGYVEHTRGKLLNRLSLTSDVVRDNLNVTQFGIDHALRYDVNGSLKVTAENRYTQGGTSGFNAIRSQGQISAPSTETGTQSSAMSTHAAVEYTPNPALIARIFGDASTISTGSNRYALGELVSYRFYSKQGTMRMVGEITETISSEKVSESEVGERDGLFLFNLRGAYLPNRFSRYGAELKYLVYSPTGAVQTIYSADATYHFSKLDLQFNYAYGTKDEETSSTPSVQEQRFGVDIRKTF